MLHVWEYYLRLLPDAQCADGFYAYNLIKENSRGLLILHYSDLLGRWYKQTVLLQFINERDNEDNMKIWAETPIVDQSKEKPHG